jgi:hypothetical protein
VLDVAPPPIDRSAIARRAHVRFRNFPMHYYPQPGRCSAFHFLSLESFRACPKHALKWFSADDAPSVYFLFLETVKKLDLF